jgi:hypothetical protein
MSDTHEVRELNRRLKFANRTMGRQGRTIAERRRLERMVDRAERSPKLRLVK